MGRRELVEREEGVPVRTGGIYDPAEIRPHPARIRAQEAALRAILERTAAAAPPVREALAEAGLAPKDVSFADLDRIRVTHKGALPRQQAQAPPFGGWLARPIDDVRRVYVSPGPIYEPEGRGRDYWGFAPALYAAGFRATDIVMNSFSYHLTPAGHMLDGALEALGCVVVPTGIGSTEIQATTLIDLAVSGFVGTPSFLATLLERVTGLGHRPALEVAFVSGEPLPAALRQQLEDGYGVRISQGYTTADVGLIAYECPVRAGLHLADRVIVEIVDPATGLRVPDGEAGEIVVTYLSDLYPLLRLGTGDLSRLTLGDCGCGRTASRLERILGRVGEAVKVRGLFIHPHDLDRAMARHPEVARYQAVVTRSGHHDELTVRVEANSVDRDRLATAVAESIRDVLRLRVVVEVSPAGTLRESDKKLLDQRTWE